MSIKIKYEPEVYVIARPQFDNLGMINFLKSNGLSTKKFENAYGRDADRLVEMATRVCYLSFEKGRSSEDFFDNIIASGHGSTIEHANFTVIIAGVSRSFTHEMVRHRAGFAYSQLSQRYVDESETSFVMPPLIQELDQPYQNAWKEEMEEAVLQYTTWVKINMGFLQKEHPLTPKTDIRKKAREAARSVLPNATETFITVTGNARAWRHFFTMRTAKFADAEMRKVAYACYEALKDETAFMFADFDVVEQDEGNGPPELVTKYPKI